MRGFQLPTCKSTAVAIGLFNRVPSGPREQCPAARIPTRGALPTRLNEWSFLSLAVYSIYDRVG